MNSTAIILAAGNGTRMQNTIPKPLHPVAGKAMINWVIDTVRQTDIDQIIIVENNSQQISKYLNDDSLEFAIQNEQNGTAGAVQVALPFIQNETVIILSGDTPLITVDTINKLMKNSTEALLAARVSNPAGYGRVILENNVVKEIIEEKEASPQDKQINLINGGIYKFKKDSLDKLIRITNDNNTGEYYLTDLAQGLTVIETIGREISGANSQQQLSQLTKIMEHNIKEQLMNKGVVIVDPGNTFISVDVTVGAGTIIQPFTVIEGPSQIGANNTIGPSAHIRPQTQTGDEVHIGNFVETKNAKIGDRTKIGHLSYVGDAVIGQDVNIGAGTIFVNYDGKDKHTTNVGNHAFIGSNTKLIAPITIEDEAITAAGSTINQDVPKHAMGIARSRQENKDNFWDRMPH